MNLRMRDELRHGSALDVKDCKREGDYYVLPEFHEGYDYCDGRLERWVWSIGRRASDGVILASLKQDLYGRDGYTCLWLR